MTRDYRSIVEQLAGRLAPDATAEDRMSAVADALWDALAGVSWVGFYTERPGAPESERLVLGPSRDTPACSPIGLHGVCGAACSSGRTQIVRDVTDLGEYYVACNPRDRSEIVVPLVGDDGRVSGVLDLDSFDTGSFDESDDAGLRAVLLAAGLTPAGPGGDG